MAGAWWMVCPHHLYKRHSLWICQHSHTQTHGIYIFWIGFVHRILFRWAHIELGCSFKSLVSILLCTNHFLECSALLLNKPHREILFMHLIRFASVENGTWNSCHWLFYALFCARLFSMMIFSVHVTQSIHWLYFNTFGTFQLSQTFTGNCSRVLNYISSSLNPSILMKTEMKSCVFEHA